MADKKRIQIGIIIVVLLLSLFLIASVQSLNWVTPPKPSTNNTQIAGNSTRTESFEDTFLVTTSGGSGVNNSLTTFDYEIMRITVVPSNPSATYHFSANEFSSGMPIDVDRMQHTGTWDIYKNHLINNDKISVQITSASPDTTFTIKVRYLANVVN